MKPVKKRYQKRAKKLQQAVYSADQHFDYKDPKQAPCWLNAIALKDPDFYDIRHLKKVNS